MRYKVCSVVVEVAQLNNCALLHYIKPGQTDEDV